MEKDETHLKWCLKQRKGIRLIKPSENLIKAYQEKSRNALRSMDVNAREGITEWAISASYYAKYFAVYALLTKIGVRCEIHDCTIALFEHLFQHRLPPETLGELRKSKSDRIETQYYTRKITIDLDQSMKDTKTFILEIEETLDSLNKEKTIQLSNELKKLTANK